MLELSIVNQTNGQYPDSQVYWSFNGQTKSIAQQPYIDMPANSAGRMYFYLGSPNSQYFDFIEFTVGASSINVDTTRVDRFGLKLALLLHGHDGSNQEVGENYATFQESRSATFAAVRELRADPVQGAGDGQRAIRHPVTGQRPGVPGGRRVRELLHQLRGGQRRHQRPHRADLRLRRHAGRQPAAVRRR